MKLLNLGCGSIFHPAWVNIDYVSFSKEVIAYDIRKKIPYPNCVFDACYSSHFLEHLNPIDAKNVINECYRVLKPKGIIRIVVPNLESIVLDYINTLTAITNITKNVDSNHLEINYDWTMLEMYDQAVRTQKGGAIKQFLKNQNNINDYVKSRISLESYKRLQSVTASKTYLEKFTKQVKKPFWPLYILQRIRIVAAKYLVLILAGKNAKLAFEEGLFRHSGEIHQWMYDRFSLTRLLKQCGFEDVRCCGADESLIPEFNHYQLDMSENQVRKPSSLFMEGIKPL